MTTSPNQTRRSSRSSLDRLLARPSRAAAASIAMYSCLVGCNNTSDVRPPTGTGSGSVLRWSGNETPAVLDTGFSGELDAVAFGGAGGEGVFVAVGEGGAILTSPDGAHWTTQSSPTSLDLFGVAFGAGRFVAVGGNDVSGAGIVLAGSADGSSWTVEDVSSTLAAPLSSVRFLDRAFVAVGNGAEMTSSDGLAWSDPGACAAAIAGPTVDFFDVAYGAGTYVVVGTHNGTDGSGNLTYDGYIATSSDGTNWGALPQTSAYLSGVTWGGGRFVAVGRGGAILTSSDATSWSPVSVAALDASKTPYLISVASADGAYVATGNYVGVSPSTGFLVRSADATSWSVAPVGVNVYGLAHGLVGGQTIWVAVGGR
jgi:hypothetical protein